MKKYVICGVSNRAMGMFIGPMLEHFTEGHSIVGLLDADPRRFEVCVTAYPALKEIPTYFPEQFEDMMKATQPDALIVTSRDDTHVDYILKGLAYDLTVITEKPMVTNAEDAYKVLKAEAKSRGKVIVAFNYRYNPFHRKIKEMVLEGKVGRVTSIDLNWYIDTYHGSSYFKRWHRIRKNSGGLSVHKSTHHFDLVNWWIDQKPVEVFAYGALHYYGPEGELNPKREAGRFCGTCDVKIDCPYYMRWTSRTNQTSVRDDHLKIEDMSQQYTNYRPDACIFDSEIDIEDTYVVNVKYDKGALLSYSVNFSTPYEGYRLAINGTRGRIETTEYHEPSRVPFPFPEQTIEYYPLFGSKEIIHVVQNKGGHGGGDPLLLEDIFLGPDPRRHYDILAGAKAGAYSIAIGEAVWRSCQENRPVKIEELLPIEADRGGVANASTLCTDPSG
ncbi:oxidoreductase domain protein [Caldalkalibacillus thermarum TA2.A1]|uniref:Gfo/Idh/MocA family oxidoreductase n=1 Tax=Caldalkalibacillus thermarum (strain TA2.A1) TaxID=986075 RepID=F5LAT4_CALTT|nr:Gfo/Idh/MocA family oxidoreductase [Caldalkalibacillus thermarum]EGL81473.1 oxidoreductase domain protein [Caldalkalibacillus thermarum TA2.A1]QZT33780.1 Gfo/Idh/MocA family oxidoreductase [Caldalkalibacillus thermarum TA2.A1]